VGGGSQRREEVRISGKEKETVGLLFLPVPSVVDFKLELTGVTFSSLLKEIGV